MTSERCVCPFCGQTRKHTPPLCHCTCGDGRKSGASTVVLKVADIPQPYKDVADLLASDGGPVRFEAMIRNAKPGLAWMIDHLDDVRGHDLTTVEGVVNACNDFIDSLIGQPPIAQGHYVRELAQKLEIPEQEVRATLDVAMRARSAYYRQHPEDRPDIGMDIPSL